MSSRAWENLERHVAKELDGKRTGYRYSPNPDVMIVDFLHLRIDAKRRKKFAHHSLICEIEDKYVDDDRQRAVLVTQGHGEGHPCVTVRLSTFREMIDEIRRLRYLAGE